MEALLAGPLRFNQLRAALGRVAAKTLSACLQELAAEDLLKHVARGEGPDGGPRVFIYELTEKGRDLSDVIASLRAWERKWAKPKE
jgi:DNA-binding HxlR family transcriptional regulator